MSSDELIVADSDLPPEVRKLLEYDYSDAMASTNKALQRSWELAGCPDRVSAIVWGATVQDELKMAIKCRLLHGEHATWLLSPDGPLGSFRAMHDLAHGAGMISDDVRNDMFHVRKIRNEFAHTVTVIDSQRDHRTVTFASDKVRFHARSLKCPDIMKRPDMRMEVLEELQKTGQKDEHGRWPFPRIHLTDARKRFEWTCQCLFTMLQPIAQSGPIIYRTSLTEATYAASRIKCDWHTGGSPLDYQPGG